MADWNACGYLPLSMTKINLLDFLCSLYIFLLILIIALVVYYLIDKKGERL